MDVGKNTALGDSDVTKKLVQLLVVADGELEMAWDDTSLFVVAGSVTSQFQNLSRQIFENGCKINGGTWTDRLSQNRTR